MEGIDLRLATDRYLDASLDLRVARATWRWIREALSIAALRHGRPGDRHLVTLSPRLLETVALEVPESAVISGTPSFEAWLESLGSDAEGFSERELAEQYAATVEASGAPDNDSGVRQRRQALRRTERNARLRERQRALFVRLEQLLVAPPNLADPVAAWFRPALAARLSAVHLHTLEMLINTIQASGYRWWTLVPRLGEKGAREIVGWLRGHEAELGVVLKPQILVPRRTLTPAELGSTAVSVSGELAPLERFRVPHHLNGENGSNRAERGRNRLAAENDFQAIQAWLGLYPADGHTWRAYRREAERFLLWAVIERGGAFSSLTVEDCVAYRSFLADPQPAARWVAPRNIERWHRGWRPFEGPLAERSIGHATTILRGLCHWLTTQRYLDSNPWEGVPRLRTTRVTVRASRSLTEAQWKLVLERLTDWPDSEARARLRFVLIFLYATGLRLSEAVIARIRHLEQVDLARDLRSVWVLHVLGKGNIEREVPIPRQVLEPLGDYLELRGLSRVIARNDPDAPLIVTLGEHPSLVQGGVATMTASALYKVLKGYFRWVAMGIRKTDPISADRLDQASTHWLRHTHGSHAVAAGVPVQTVRENLGHASLATTTIYVTTERAKRYREIGEFVEAGIE